jgi:hypothetical protein
VKLSSNLHAMPRSRMVELYLHSSYVFMAWSLFDQAQKQLYLFTKSEMTSCVTAVTVNSTFACDVTPCSLVADTDVSEEYTVLMVPAPFVPCWVYSICCLAHSLNLKMEYAPPKCRYIAYHHILRTHVLGTRTHYREAATHIRCHSNRET